jgi:outer membrane protein OmpU
MKRVLFATTATSALLLGGIASAQGIALFGDARLGLGYNIENDGDVLIEDGDTPDDLRAVSRVRFGVNMTGETDSGITFGATIRADNAIGGQGGDNGQTAGSVFVSGSWGTLTYGDTNAADEQWVGDVPGDYSLTSLNELDESRFISNGGGFGGEGGNDFAANPFARPTVRYDFDIMGFGASLSSNRDLTDIVVGAGYATDFGGGSWSIGAGYNNFEEFTIVGDPEPTLVDTDGDGIPDDIVDADPVGATIPDGEQWSLGLDAEYATFGFGVTYLNLDASSDDLGDFKADNLLIGASAGWDAWSFGVIYGKILSAEGELEDIDGDDSWQLSGQYDLGGGATVNGGVRWTYDILELGGDDDDDGGDQAVIADFGIKMAF